MFNRDALARKPLPHHPQEPLQPDEQEQREQAEEPAAAPTPHPFAAYFPIIIVAILLAYVIVGRSAYIAELGYEVSDVRNQVQVAEADLQRLNVQQAGMLSLTAVEEQAAATHGLLPPTVRWMAAAPEVATGSEHVVNEVSNIYVVDRTGVRAISDAEERWFDIQRRVAASILPGRQIEASEPEAAAGPGR